MLDRRMLIFDADDTLWENNVIFERVIESFLDWVCQPAERLEVRAVLDAIEAENALTLGYGAEMFRRSLGDCLQRLNSDRALTREELEQVDGLVAPLLHRTIETISGVPETLTELGARNELLLLTKGDQDEQQRKVEASQLRHHFRSIHIVPEKTVETYHQLMAELSLPPERTWMIGNSPKSDIIPARRAGLHAVYIPHPHTWALEHEEFEPDDRTLSLNSFPELLHHF